MADMNSLLADVQGKEPAALQGGCAGVGGEDHNIHDRSLRSETSSTELRHMAGASERKPIWHVEKRMDLKSLCDCCSASCNSKIEGDSLFNEKNAPWKVLFFATWPHKDEIEVDKEWELIKENFTLGAIHSKLTQLASQVTFTFYFHRDITELKRILHEEKPVVLHLACHGDSDGSVKIGGKEMTKENIVKDIKSMIESDKRLRMVVLNLCWSGVLAKELLAHVDFVFGHDMEVVDKDALAFSKEFYYWLGANNSILEAADSARKKCDCCHLLTRRKELAGLNVWSRTVAEWKGETMPNVSSLTVAEREGETMLSILGEQGFAKEIAARICEELKIENWKKSDIEYLTESSLQDVRNIDGMGEHHKKKFVDLVKTMQQELASKCSPNDSDSNDSDQLSDADTLSIDSGDREQEYGVESIAARNAGEIEDFKDDITSFIRDFCNDFDEYRVFVDAAANGKDEVIRSTFVSRALKGEWTLCMLLWMWFIKGARPEGETRSRWVECMKGAATEAELLKIFDSCLQGQEVSHCAFWPCKESEFQRLNCNKLFARALYVTDCIVQQHFTASNTTMANEWREEVIQEWYTSEEDHTCMLLRANKFLRRQLDGISILTHVVKTSSYVCSLWMPSLTALLLFAYLEARAGEHEALHGPGSDTSLLFRGFRMFASSRGRLFTLTKADRPSEADLRQLRGELRMFAGLPLACLRLLGPVLTSDEMAREVGRSFVTLHQASKLRACKDAMRTYKGVHLRGPAGTGKTFVALHFILTEIERDSNCTVLFLAKSLPLVLFLARWLISMAKHRMENRPIYGNLFFAHWNEKQQGWSHPFTVLERGGELVEEEKQVEFLSSPESEYKFILIDEAHHVYSNPRAHDLIRERSYERCKLVLTSDSSQATKTDIAFPQGLKDVQLSEVVRNSERTMTASLLFNKGIAKEKVTCHHRFAGQPLKPYIFSTPSEEPLTPQQYVPVIVTALRDLAAEYKQSLHHRVAVLVHEDLLQQDIRQALQARLDLDAALCERRLKLVDASEVCRDIADKKERDAAEEIVCDSVDNFDGMESLLVIAAGLDGDQRQQERVDEHRSLLYRAITRAERDGKVAVVNHRIEGGCFSFLDAIDFTEDFDGVEERIRLGDSLGRYAVKPEPFPPPAGETTGPAVSTTSRDKTSKKTRVVPFPYPVV
eukprot:757699-Hanusia_phi.AAC.2